MIHIEALASGVPTRTLSVKWCDKTGWCFFRISRWDDVLPGRDDPLGFFGDFSDSWEEVFEMPNAIQILVHI